MRRAMSKIQHHSYTFSFLLILIIFRCTLSISKSTLSSTESLTISSKRTIVSPGDNFELGFFKPSSRSRWYLGIWYKKIPDRTYVWVANRDQPVSNSIGALKISDRNLVIVDQFKNSVWSTNLTRGDMRSPVVAELLDNGNFVLRYSNNNDPNEFMWQSFDFPTDTLLPHMKLGRNLKRGINRVLTSWTTLDDPSSGNYSFSLKTRGLPEFFLRHTDSPLFRSGPWDGKRFSGIPRMQQWSYIAHTFTENREEVAYAFFMTNQSIYSRLIMSSTGGFRGFTWILTSWGWNLFWFAPTDMCDGYGVCGPYGFCDMNTSPVCNCMRGFYPRNMQRWALTDGSGGCLRRTQLSCRGDGFLRLKNMKLPDTTTTIVDRTIGIKECRARCVKDCNCTAFANTDIQNGGSGCVIWTSDLEDLRNYADGGQDLYVRLAASDLEKKRNINKKIIGLIIGVSLTVLPSFIIFFFWKRKQKRERERARARARARARPRPRPSSTYNGHGDRSDGLLIHGSISSSNTTPTTLTTPLTTNATQSSKDDVLDIDFELPLIDFTTIAKATNYFSDSNKLGQGGYGIVYKQGRLPNGKDVAVKRLSVTSKQGVVEFKNEIKLIARLQHINLVRLLACCVDQDENILIYEYLENRSLDSFVFDEASSFKLDWETRFEIINGMARGLLYLHQDSRFRIIHRDFKTSNILLDKNMTPKISDFGMARIFECDTTEDSTVRIVGTYGYMSPEYAMKGLYSTKSDVYSFGVTLLEIICGRKNNRTELNLIGRVYYSWKQGNEIEVIDRGLIDSSVSSLQKIKRCLQIGLLCVQKEAIDRPAMSSVVMMLASEIPIPIPNHPDFFVDKSPSEETDATPSVPLREEVYTVNQVSVSIVQPR